MKIIITGIQGFIGNNLANYCSLCGMQVTGIDFHKNIENETWKYYCCDLVKDNICNIILDVLPDAIVHCAGSADVKSSIENPENDFQKNFIMTQNILYSLKSINYKCKFIFLSSAGVYGQPRKLPIDEDTKYSPMSPYALHKVIGEKMCMYFREIEGYDAIVLRIFSAFGPGLRKQVFWDMWNKIKNTGRLDLYGSGLESRDFIYIEDLVRIIYDIINFAERSYDIINIASGKEITINEIAKIFVEESGYNKDIIRFLGIKKEGDPDNWCADISRVNSITKIQLTDIRSGIRKYIDWLNTLDS